MKTKKLLSIILTIFVVNLSFISALSVSAQTTEGYFNKGVQVVSELKDIVQTDEKQTNEFIIKNKEDFSKFMITSEYWENDYKVTLACDIDMQGEVFNSIETFNGQFDGVGHTVSNISFKCFVENNHGTISDVKFNGGNLINGSECGFVFNNEEDGLIVCCSVDNMNSEGANIKSGFVCINRGKITNSKTTFSFKNIYDGLGGFVDENYGTIEECVATGNVIGFIDIGGFVGYNGGTINNCIAAGNVTGNQYIGGFVGQNYGGTITGCIVTGNAIGGEAGGFVGENVQGTITNCIAKGDVNGEKISLERFVGSNNYGKIEDCKVG